MSKISPDKVLLGLLEAKSCHGYQLLEHFHDPECLGKIWRLSTSQLYSVLKRLERSDLIDGREEESKDAPMRTIYWLTETGRHVLHQWLAEDNPSPSTRAIRTEFLSRLYISRLLQSPVAEIIEAQKRSCEQHITILRDERDALKKGAGYLAVDLHLREMQVILTWLDTADTLFERIESPPSV